MPRDVEKQRPAVSAPGRFGVFFSLRQTTISQQLFLYFAAAIAALTIVLWVNYASQCAALERQMDAAALKEVSVVAQAIDLFVEKCAARVAPIASHEKTADDSRPGEMRRFLVDMLDNTPWDEAFDFYIAYERMDAGDPDANIVVDRVSWPKTYGSLYDYHDPKQSWYHVPKTTGKAYLTEPYFDAGSVNQTMISYTIPIYGSNYDFIAVAGVDILLNGLEDIVAETHVLSQNCNSEEQVVFLLSKTNNLIIHPNSLLLPWKNRSGTNLSGIPEGDFVQPIPQGIQKAVIKGEARRLYWATAPETGWRVVANVSEHSLMSPIRRMSARLRNLSLLALLATLGVVLMSVVHFTRPIRKLAQYAAGDNSQVMVTHRGDEIGQIGRSFKELVTYQVELDRANKDLESFAYSVSHDLRAPLRAISGYSTILLEDHLERLDAEGQQLCKLIEKSSKKMSCLIDDLLAFSRLNREAMEPTLIDMTALVTDVFYEICPYQDRARATFRVKELPGSHGDARLLRQVWVNLLSNALKFSSKRESSIITVSGEVCKGEVLYTIEDNGVGFDMRFSKKLFTVFQRLHNEREFPGTGVGLAIVHRVIERHGGRVWAESVVDQGAVFHFSLPLVEKGRQTELGL